MIENQWETNGSKTKRRLEGTSNSKRAVGAAMAAFFANSTIWAQGSLAHRLRRQQAGVDATQVKRTMQSRSGDPGMMRGSMMSGMWITGAELMGRGAIGSRTMG